MSFSQARQVKYSALGFSLHQISHNSAIRALRHNNEVLGAAKVGIRQNTRMDQANTSFRTVTKSCSPACAPILIGFHKVTISTRSSIVCKHNLHACSRSRVDNRWESILFHMPQCNSCLGSTWPLKYIHIHWVSHFVYITQTLASFTPLLYECGRVVVPSVKPSVYEYNIYKGHVLHKQLLHWGIGSRILFYVLLIRWKVQFYWKLFQFIAYQLAHQLANCLKAKVIALWQYWADMSIHNLPACSLAFRSSFSICN